MSRGTIAMTGELTEYLRSVTPALHGVNRRLREVTAGLPNAEMQISVEQGQLMGLLTRATNARRALEVGTFTGYSALVVAQALPEDGRLTACDISHEWTSIGWPFWKEAGVAHKIDLRLGPAVETLTSLLADGGAGTFDLAFIDADKVNYDQYYELTLQLLRPGGLMGIDNTLWSGKVADDSVQDADTVAIRALNRKLAEDGRVVACMVPIGDGFSLACKR